jgi:hypothetical protein
VIHSAGVPMRFVKPRNVRGSDYDVEITQDARPLIACELKAKSAATDPNRNSLMNILRKAADQLPSDMAGMVLVRFPYNWTLSGERGAELGAAVEAFHRNNARIVATCCHWERITSHVGPMCYSVAFQLVRNPQPRIDSEAISNALDRMGSSFFERTEPTGFAAIARAARVASAPTPVARS